MEVVDDENAGSARRARQQGAADEPRQPCAAADPLRALRLGRPRRRADPSGRPFDRIERVDGRSDDVLSLRSRAAARRRPSVPAACPVLRCPTCSSTRSSTARNGAARPDRAPGRCTADLRGARPRRARARLCRGRRRVRIDVEVVEAIEREPGHAAKLKLVRLGVAVTRRIAAWRSRSTSPGGSRSSPAARAGSGRADALTLARAGADVAIADILVESERVRGDGPLRRAGDRRAHAGDGAHGVDRRGDPRDGPAVRSRCAATSPTARRSTRPSRGSSTSSARSTSSSTTPPRSTTSASSTTSGPISGSATCAST